MVEVISRHEWAGLLRARSGVDRILERMLWVGVAEHPAGSRLVQDDDGQRRSGRVDPPDAPSVPAGAVKGHDGRRDGRREPIVVDVEAVHLSVSTLADEYWAFHRGTAQLWNIDRGDVDHVEHWEDLSPSATRSRIEALHGFVGRSEELLGSTSGQDRTLVLAVEFSATATIVSLPYLRDSALVAGPLDFVGWMTVLVPAYGLTTAAHGLGYVQKLRSAPEFVDRWIDGLRDGSQLGRTATARGVAGSVSRIDDWLALPVDEDPLVGQDPPSELSEREISAWRNDLVAAIPAIRSSLERLRKVLVEEIAPIAPGDDRPGLAHRPNGASDYDALLYAATSTRLSAEEIHQLGRELLDRLDDEYSTLGRDALGEDDPTTVRTRLRDDPSLRYRSADDVIDDATAIVARAVSAAPAWFSTVPTATCVVTPVRGQGFAFYTAPSPDGRRPGTCYVNIAHPSIWTYANLEATIFHECVPGHHLQLAGALDRDLHPVLGELEVTSFGEGWGLYAERLADEIGLYSGPLQRLGMLTLDSLRAARLTVDTGLHAVGWSRDQAIDFLVDSTPLTRTDAESEVDRYVADPGQATSYMVGRIELNRLRTTAQARLGDRFDIAEFHDVVLGSGMTPLDRAPRRNRPMDGPGSGVIADESAHITAPSAARIPHRPARIGRPVARRARAIIAGENAPNRA